MSFENNLKVLTNINLNNSFLEYSNGSFKEIKLLRKIIYCIQNIIYKLVFLQANAFDNCKPQVVSHQIYTFLESNKHLTKQQFSVIKQQLEILKTKAVKRQKDYAGDLKFLSLCTEELEKERYKSFFSFL